MLHLWADVGAEPGGSACAWANGGGGSGALEFNATRLRLFLDYGHDAIEPQDDPAEIIRALCIICDTLNSDHGLWPETHGYTEDDPEWLQMMGRLRRARESGPDDD